MESKRQYISVIAICLSVIIAGAIIAYNPFQEKEDELDSLFKFPAGIPPSLGTMSAVSLGEDVVNAIIVSGSGSISAKANQATLTLGAWTEDSDASEAVNDNAVIMGAVIAAIMELGIEEDNIQTVSYGVSPNYDWETRSVLSYRVTNMIQVEVLDIDMVGEVIDVAAAAGANSIQGISFGISDEESEALSVDAYVLALEDAQAKADLIAETLGIEVTGVVYVTESSYAPFTQSRAMAESAVYDSGFAPTPIIEGSLSVSVTVTVAFSIQ